MGMQRRRTVVVRCRWGSVPAGWPEPPAIPDDTLRAMFSATPTKWGVAQLWHDATIGLIEFAPTELVDVGSLAGLDLVQNPDGSLSNPNRTTTVEAAVMAATNQGFTFGPDDVPVVLIAPPPCDAGAVGSPALGRTACLFDVNGNQSYMAHELGHALGFQHSFGPAFGDPEAEYCDPYCVMSHAIDGYKAPWANGMPPEWAEPAGLPAGWTVQMGPLPAAATVWRFLPEFAESTSVATVAPATHRTAVTLSSYGTAVSPSNLVLVRAATPGGTWFVEYRGAHGWDRGIGLGPKPNPGAGDYDPTPPGIVVHRLNTAGGVVFAGVIDTRGGGRWWVADNGDLDVHVLGVAADGVTATVEIGPPRLEARPVGSATSPYGAALASVDDVFVDQHQYVAWTGTGDLRPNVARSDGADHQQAVDDSATGTVAVACEGRSMWVAWSGTNPGHSLNLATGPPDRVFERFLLRGDASPAGPALAMFGGRPAVAYLGEDGGVYVAPGADDDGGPTFRVPDAAAVAGPGLAAAGGLLYVAWAAEPDGTLDVASSPDGAGGRTGGRSPARPPVSPLPCSAPSPAGCTWPGRGRTAASRSTSAWWRRRRSAPRTRAPPSPATWCTRRRASAPRAWPGRRAATTSCSPGPAPTDPGTCTRPPSGTRSPRRRPTSPEPPGQGPSGAGRRIALRAGR
jgi:hypothetical protein